MGGNRARSACDHIPPKQMSDISLIERASQPRGDPSQHTRGPHRGTHPHPRTELHTHAQPHLLSTLTSRTHLLTLTVLLLSSVWQPELQGPPIALTEAPGPRREMGDLHTLGCGAWPSFPADSVSPFGAPGLSQHGVPAFPQYFAERAPAL